jgi:4-hydroxyphenylpyruvate dioxygenase
MIPRPSIITSITPAPERRAVDRAAQEADPLGIRGWDHVELWVANAKQAAHFWRTVAGFTPVAYAGLETGRRDSASYVLTQGKVRLVVSAPYAARGAMAETVARHGDTVRSLALSVHDVERAYAAATAAGATGVQRPTELRDDHGLVRTAAIQLYGDVVHTFVDRSDYAGAFLPGYRAMSAPATGCGLAALDHVAACVALGRMPYWVDWYERVLGFRNIDLNNITTEYSALMSKVMANRGGRLKFPINEPTEGPRRSQIQEFLDYHGGEGVQHLALATRDIIGTVRQLKANGLEFLGVPRTYYDALPERVGTLAEPIEALAELGILADRDDEGYLLQIFARPIGDRPTLFLEIIQRRGSRGFGAANVKALFEALERAQAERGNL